MSGPSKVVKSRSKVKEFVYSSPSFKDPPKPTSGPTFDLLEFYGVFGASRRTQAT